MLIGVPAETRPGETRVAATAETVKKLVAGKHTVLVEAGAGLAASQTDEMYAAAGAQIGTAAQALGAEMVLKVRLPAAGELAQMKQGAVLIGMLEPFNAERPSWPSVPWYAVASNLRVLGISPNVRYGDRAPPDTPRHCARAVFGDAMGWYGARGSDWVRARCVAHCRAKRGSRLRNYIVLP